MKIAASIVLAMLICALGVVAAPAEIITDEPCWVLDTTGKIWNGFDVYYSHSVGTNSMNGNAVRICHGWLPDGAEKPKKAIMFNNENTGYRCDTLFGITYDWQLIITPSGRVTLTCHYKEMEE